MKILLTGGAGFIGSWIADKLLKKNHSVTVIDNFSTGRTENKNQKASYYEEDITSEKIHEIIAKEKPDLVIHCAANALLRKSLEDPVADAQTNILGTINVLESCKKNNIAKILYTSTGGARVGEPRYLPVDEKHPIHPLSPYGISKHTAEHYVELYTKLYNIQSLTLCFGNVYGPRDTRESKRLIPMIISALQQNHSPIIFGDGNQTRDFIYVEDLADLIVNSIDKIGKTNELLFHLANGNQISVNEILMHLQKISNKTIEAMHEPSIKGEVRDIVLDITLAKKELNWNPKTAIEEGLKKTWDWFEHHRVSEK